MKLDRTFYCSWFLVVLGSFGPRFFVGAQGQLVPGELPSQNGSRADLDSPLATNATGHQTDMADSGSNATVYGGPSPTDHFIWEATTRDNASDGQALMGHVLQDFGDTYTVTQCALRCMRRVPDCKSFNFREELHSCSLNSRSDLDSPAGLASVNGSVYHRLETFQTHQVRRFAKTQL